MLNSSSSSWKVKQDAGQSNNEEERDEVEVIYRDSHQNKHGMPFLPLGKVSTDLYAAPKGALCLLPYSSTHVNKREHVTFTLRLNLQNCIYNRSKMI